MIYVLDASILIKWFVEEPDSMHALNFRIRLLDGAINIAFPDLALYEVGNTLRQKRSFTEHALAESLTSLLHLDLDIVSPTENLLRETGHISQAKNLTFYDAAYVALAAELKATLVTADLKLARAAKDIVPVETLLTVR